MKLFSIAVFLLLCMETYAQERFNKIIYDNDPHIGNTVIAHDDSYVVLTGSLVNGERGIAFTKLDLQGNIILQKKYRKDNFMCLEGYNCMKYDSLHNTYYMCGIAITYDYQNKYPFVVVLDEELDTLSFLLLEPDTAIYGTYNIEKLNDSVYAIVSSSIVSGQYDMSLILYNIGIETIEDEINIGGGSLFETETGTCVLKTNSNNILLGGYTFSFNSGNFAQDWYLVKTDSIGNMIWQQHYGNPVINDGYISGMLQVSDTSYMLCGGQGICNDWSGDALLEACMRIVDTSGTLLNEYFYRFFVFNQNENQMWYSNTYFVDILEEEDGSFTGLLSIKRENWSDIFALIKLTRHGEIQWTKQLETSEILGFNFPASLKKTEDGGYILHGHGDFDGTYDPGQQAWLVKTDSLGNEGSLYLAPPPENIECVNLPDTIFCGIPNNFKLHVQGKSAPYTIEFSTGEIIEDLYYPPIFIPESQGTGFFSVHVGTNTYYHTYNSATLYSEIPSDDKIEMPFSITVPYNYEGPELSVTITNGYGETYQIVLPVYVDCNVSSEPLSETAAIQVYPNPATDYLQIQLPDENEVSFVKILNMQGQTVLVQSLQSQTTRLDISGLALGTYMVRLYYGHRIENVRVEKQ